MTAIDGALVKKLRKELKLTQEAFADRVSVSVKTLYRIESNKSDIDVFQFMDMLRIFDKPLEDFFLMFLDSQEYRDYKIYIDAIVHLVAFNADKFFETMDGLQGSPLLSRPDVQQQMAYVAYKKKVMARSDGQNDFTLEDLDGLLEIIRITIKDFDTKAVASYLFAGIEESVIGVIAAALYSSPAHIKEAIALITAMQGQDRLVPASSVALVYWQGRLVLSYFSAKMYHEALDLALEVSKRCVKENYLDNIPNFYRIIACCYKHLGEDETKYKPYILRAYYTLQLIGHDAGIGLIRTNVKDELGADLDDWIKEAESQHLKPL